jgi:hypothetical protein
MLFRLANKAILNLVGNLAEPPVACIRAKPIVAAASAGASNAAITADPLVERRRALEVGEAAAE